ncbi:MAG: aspartate aminotransferase family protein [Solirubrobacterales bacterium]|nr:aspartate aminotransferase family protein [Solirubrobacterales bacterium]
MSDSPDKYLWHPFAQMGKVSDHQLVLTRGDDVWVWDDDGNRYLDATASLWYANVGHGRESIRDAVSAQMDELEAYSTFGDFANPPALELAERLSRLSPIPDARVFLTSGGGDSIDTAAKLARRYWHEQGHDERHHLIARVHGYHGTHGFGTSLAGIPPNRTEVGRLVEDVSVVGHDDARDLSREIERVGAERVAAFFLEPVIGAGGVYPPPDGYVEEVAAICRETGVLLVVDSVICAFGRLGTWYGIERWPGVVPDMITFAKGVTSGYLPLGGVVISDQIAAPFWDEPDAPPFRHGATYAGHPSCCAAALENIRILEDENLLPRGRELEGELFSQVDRAAGLEAAAEVRGGTGLLAAVEISAEVMEADPGAPVRLAMLARERGVLVRPLGRGVAVSPPLTVGTDHLEMIGDALVESVRQLA